MIENIRKIAEGLGLKIVREHDRGMEVYYHLGRGGHVKNFNPYESNADAFLVLEDLVNKDKTLGVEFINQGGDDYSVDVNSIFNGYVRADNKDLKHAICSAWLSLKGDV